MKQYIVTTWIDGIKRTEQIGDISEEALRRDFGDCDRVLIQQTVDVFGWAQEDS